MHNHTLSELSRLLQNRECSSVELTQHFLNRIKQYDQKLNSFITVTEDIALAQAEQADKMREQGNAQPLTGIPIAHKDIFCTKGVRTSSASKMLDNFIAPYNATLVEKLQHAGVVMLGKTNMDEFAMGSSNEYSYYGPVHNPWNLNHVPGGSSGGSAAAVAARLAPAATGTDTGGSIRQPAAFCGLTGIKPTYGRISRYGMIAFASSLDQAGPMTQTAEDAAMLLNAMSGHDPRDSTSLNVPVPDFCATLSQPLKGLRIGLPEEFFSSELNPAIADLIQKAINELTNQGAVIKKIHLPHVHAAVAAYYVVAPAEASSNLARFDGVRYGYRCDAPKNLEDLYKRSRGEGFGAEVKRRIMIGTYVLSSGHYDAYYGKAQKIRRLIRDDFHNAFKEVDVIASPTSPTTAFELDGKHHDPVSMYLSDIFTIAINLAGVPSLSMPVGFINGLPVGMQLISNYLDEARMLNIAHQYQQITDWHKKMPETFF